MCRWIAVTLLCLCPLLAQDSAPPPTVFSVSTTLVEIDCVVTDSAGRQVTSLQPQDFEVVVDGKPQTITNFSYVRLDAPDVNRPSLSPQALGKPLAPANTADVLKPADVRRSMVLVVDDLSLSFESMVYVRRALHKFIDEQMQPGDLVALWETGRTNSVFQQFTSDKRVLAAAVETVRWNPRGLGLVSPFEPDVAGRSSRGIRNAASQTSREQRSDESDELEYVRLNSTSGALDTLGQLMDELRPVGGRKAVVLFSDGIYLPGIDLPGQHVSMAGADELRTRFRRMIDKANRAGAVVYTVDSRGLVYLAPEKLGSLWLSQEGLVELAENTGGFATVNGNGLSEAIQRVENDQTGYYLIGFKAPENISTTSAGAKADYHTLKVKVHGHGLSAHSRSGFFGETDDVSRPKYDTRQAQMLATVQSLFNKSDIHVRMTALYRRTTDGHSYVHNLLYIDPREITFQTDLFGTHYAALDLYILASGYGVDPLASVSRHISIDANDERLKKLQTGGLLLTLDVPVKHPGPYQVRACVLDSIARTAGSAGQYIDVPDLKKQHVALTTPLIDDVSNPAETRFNDVPSALREFHAGSRLAFAFRVETDKPGKYDTEIQLYHDRTPVLENPVAVAPAPGKDAHAVSGELRLKNALPPGQYYLQAMATDHTGKTPHSASSWIEFEVVP
ncbi:MAG: VWA domain-containing protein [Bryobacteraceae bacterium]|jgi:VWFA-related protein